MSDSTNDNDIEALLDYLNAQCLPGYRKALTALVAERNRLRQCLPPTAHTGILNGPGEGTWSAFALKVVEQRDNLIEERNALKQRVKELERELSALRAAAAVKMFDEAIKQRDEVLQAKSPADSQLCALKPWMELVTGIMRSSQSIHCDTKLRLVENLNAAIAAMERGEPDGK